MSEISESVMGLGLTKTAERFRVLLRNAHVIEVLDLGCGDGRNAIAFAQKGLTVRALDASAAALERLMARARMLSIAEQVIPVQEDIRRWEPDRQYEAIVCTEVFQYFSPEMCTSVLERMTAATASGGYNYLSVFADIRRIQNGRPFEYEGTLRLKASQVRAMLAAAYEGWHPVAWELSDYDTPWPPSYVMGSRVSAELDLCCYDIKATAVELIARKDLDSS